MAYDMTRLQEVKAKVSVPMYFYNIIIPQRADYYNDYEVDFDSRPVVKCPIHDEDTPSMRFYEETNTFFCFGCRAGGDVVELHRKYTERTTDVYPSFEDSVDFLYDFFIKGNENARVIKLKGKLNESKQLSSQVEIVRYTNYAAILEGQLGVDGSISDRAKMDIWRALDYTDVLISKNEINALDALDYVKSIVRQSIK